MNCLKRRASITIYIIVSKMKMFCFPVENPGSGTFFCLREVTSQFNKQGDQSYPRKQS